MDAVDRAIQKALEELLDACHRMTAAARVVEHAQEKLTRACERRRGLRVVQNDGEEATYAPDSTKV